MSAETQIIYDTVRTVVFDTVHVLMDSSITVQALKDSQEFYSGAFGLLLSVFALFVTVATVIWGIRLYIETKKVKKIADYAASEASERIKEEFDERIANVCKLANELISTTVDLRKTVIDELFTQARLAEKKQQVQGKTFRNGSF